MRTTLDIKDAILRDLRDRAAERRRPFREVVEEALTLGLAQQSQAQSRQRFTVTPHRAGLKPGFRGVSLNQLYDQLETEHDAGPR
jgi:hypothetical protein